MGNSIINSKIIYSRQVEQELLKWIQKYSHRKIFLATEEKVDCEYRADNSSWFPGNEYCNDDFFLYDENLENRQRLTIFDRHQLHSPVWLPIDGISPTWAQSAQRLLGCGDASDFPGGADAVHWQPDRAVKLMAVENG